jgi:two-component system sensor histidine kinase YcbA
MSILANLVQNAIESGDRDNMNYISLNVVEQKDQLYIKVKDTGEGIEPEHLDNIFKPGFSTKFDVKTGDINRGVGLSLVKGLVEEHFLGTMEVKSKVNEGTKFFIKIPLSVLKGDL